MGTISAERRESRVPALSGVGYPRGTTLAHVKGPGRMGGSVTGSSADSHPEPPAWSQLTAARCRASHICGETKGGGEGCPYTLGCRGSPAPPPQTAAPRQPPTYHPAPAHIRGTRQAPRVHGPTWPPRQLTPWGGTQPPGYLGRHLYGRPPLPPPRPTAATCSALGGTTVVSLGKWVVGSGMRYGAGPSQSTVQLPSTEWAMNTLAP